MSVAKKDSEPGLNLLPKSKTSKSFGVGGSHRPAAHSSGKDVKRSPNPGNPIFEVCHGNVVANYVQPLVCDARTVGSSG